MCTPLALLVFACLFFIRIVGERFVDLHSFIVRHEDYLIGYTLNESDYDYINAIQVSSQNQQVLALGSSRVLQFRESMFSSPFYTIGLAISGTDDLGPFIDFFEDEGIQPKLLLLGLDQWMYNRAYASSYTKEYVPPKLESQLGMPDLPALRTALKNAFRADLSRLLEAPDNKLGFKSRLHNMGLREDGSWSYGDKLAKDGVFDRNSWDYNFSDTYSRISQGNRRFEHGDTPDSLSLSRTKDALQRLKSLNIRTVVFLPPFAPSVLDSMHKSGNYGYLNELPALLKVVCEATGHQFLDLSGMSCTNCTDSNYIDGFHGSEAVYLQILATIADSNQLASTLIDGRIHEIVDQKIASPFDASTHLE